jgi:hypothetical protein
LCIERWKTRIMYTPASTTPTLATRPYTSLSSKAPNRIRISPTKFAEPGIARVAKVTIRNSAASTGALKATPPSSASDSLPFARAAITPMIRNSGTTTSPWLTICITAPCAPLGSKAKMPSTMKPSWAIEE